MLGSGIFVLPGIAAGKTGPSIWLAYLLAAIFILPAALSKSELATAMPTSGGTYVYIERTFRTFIRNDLRYWFMAFFIVKKFLCPGWFWSLFVHFYARGFWLYQSTCLGLFRTHYDAQYSRS